MKKPSSLVFMVLVLVGTLALLLILYSGQSGPAFTAFHHKLNVYTALLSRLRPLQI